MSFITPNQFSKILTLPVSLPQTELRRGRSLEVMAFDLAQGQKFEVMFLTLHLVKVLVTNETPIKLTSSCGLVCGGLYTSQMACSSPTLLVLTGPGTLCLNPYRKREFRSPGRYYFRVWNNTRNIDITVAMTGSIRIWL